MLSFYEVADGFTVTADFSDAIGDECLSENAKAILDAADEGYMDDLDVTLDRFFKKSEGWTRDMVQKMCDTFNGSAL